MEFLNNVGRNSEVNKMNSKNLAIVMAPNILYSKMPDYIREMKLARDIVTPLIQEVEFFFYEK